MSKKVALQRIVLSLSSVCITVLIIEGSARLLHEPGSDRGRAGFVVPDPDLLWRLKPFQTGPRKTNNLGFRDLPYHAERKRKVLVLGDSITWGDGIFEVEALYPSLLEIELNGPLKSPIYDVINTGVPGYSTRQERIYLELYGLEFDPCVIIVQFCLNDPIDPFLTQAEWGGDTNFLGIDTRNAVKGLRGFLLRNSRAYEWALRRLQGIRRREETYKVEKLTHPQLPRALEHAWTIAISELNRISRLAKNNGIPLILYIAPYRFQVQNPSETGQPQERLRTWAREEGVTIVDPLDEFAAAASSGVKLFKDANHFSKEGHLLTAHSLLAPVRELCSETTSSSVSR